MQGDVNAHLTQKMEDARATEASKSSANKKKTQEEKEEEMYGEEDPEDES